MSVCRHALPEDQVNFLVQKWDLQNTVFEFQKSAFHYEHKNGDIFLLSYTQNAEATGFNTCFGRY